MTSKMKKMKSKDEIIRYLWRKISKLGLLNFVPDKAFVKLEYRIKLGKKLDLELPQRYNEKIQWLKLYDHNPKYTKLVDKYEVREYVRNLIGEEYLIPAYGVYDTFDDIDFDQLPNEFVLKPTHTSGDVFLCKDKSKIDMTRLRKEVNSWMGKNYFYYHREWPYKNIKPRIVCEKFMSEDADSRIKDYKFFCFNGKSEMMFVASDRGTDTKFDFYDMDFTHLNVKQHYPKSPSAMVKPANYEEMITLTQTLAKDFPHVRIDLYSINGKIYFGEFTFYHFSGFEEFEPDSFDYDLGSKIQLPKAAR